MPDLVAHRLGILGRDRFELGLVLGATAYDVAHCAGYAYEFPELLLVLAIEALNAEIEGRARTRLDQLAANECVGILGGDERVL